VASVGTATATLAAKLNGRSHDIEASGSSSAFLGHPYVTYTDSRVNADPVGGFHVGQSLPIGGGSHVDCFAVSGPRTGWHLIDGAPSIGSRANEPLEYRGKVSLRLEAHRQGDFDDWRRRVLQQFLSPQNSPPQNKLMWS
jgi:hypothetical protein